MLIEERKNRIIEIVNERECASVLELTELLETSASTIRRDIQELSREGRLLKIHGGAMKLNVDESDEQSETVLGRNSSNKEEKIRIAEYAASLVLPGEYVFIDAGTTTSYVIGYLSERRATYVTNSVSHAADLVKRRFKVFLIGGEMRENTDVLVGSDAILQLQKYNFNRGFFGANGIDVRLGFTTNDVREGLIKRVAIESTDPAERYVLSDSSKFGLMSAITFSEVDKVKVITGAFPGDKYRKIIDFKVV